MRRLSHVSRCDGAKADSETGERRGGGIWKRHLFDQILNLKLSELRPPLAAQRGRDQKERPVTYVPEATAFAACENSRHHITGDDALRRLFTRLRAPMQSRLHGRLERLTWNAPFKAPDLR